MGVSLFNPHPPCVKEEAHEATNDMSSILSKLYNEEIRSESHTCHDEPHARSTTLTYLLFKLKFQFIHWLFNGEALLFPHKQPGISSGTQIVCVSGSMNCIRSTRD